MNFPDPMRKEISSVSIGVDVAVDFPLEGAQLGAHLHLAQLHQLQTARKFPAD